MSKPALHAGTGDPAIDQALADAAALLEGRFSQQLRSLYLLGSWVYDDARTTSDIDLTAVFRADAPPEIGREARDLVDGYSQRCGLPIGVFPVIAGRLRPLAAVQLKRGALHLFGDDIRAEIELPSSAAWARDLMHGMYLVVGISRGLQDMTLPLEYPEPDDEFFGMTVERAKDQEGNPRRGTRDLVTGTGWYATALVAWRAGVMVTRKTHAPSSYEAYVGDQWAPFVRELFSQCRDRWDYRIPSDAEDRRKLQELCRLSLEFENHFLACYREFIIAELASSDNDARAGVTQTLGRLPFRDIEIDDPRGEAACAKSPGA